MTIHSPSCALHNATASEPGPCDCGATDILERIEDKLAGVLPGAVAQLLAECAVTIKAYRAENASNLAKIQSNNAQIEADYDEYRAALLKYGQHLGPCDAILGVPCTCGFEQARETS